MISWRRYDKLPGYRAAKREAILGFEHRQHKRRFSELSGDAVCNQEYACGLKQRLHDEVEPVVA